MQPSAGAGWARWTRWSLSHPRIICALVLAVTGLAAWGWHLLRFDFSNEALFQVRDETRDRYESFIATFGTDDTWIYLAYEAPDAYLPAELKRNDQLAGALAGVPNVVKVYSLSGMVRAWGFRPEQTARIRERAAASLWARNLLVNSTGRVTSLILSIAPDKNSDQGRAQVMTDVDRVLAEQAPGVEFHRAGLPVIQREYIRVMVADQVRFFPAVFLLVVLTLQWMLRDLRLVFACLATVALAVFWTGGLMGWTGVPVNVISHILPTMLLVIGIADLLHLALRFREEARSLPPFEAAVSAARHVGTACLMTTVTTQMGFGSLMFMRNPTVGQFGLIAAGGLGLAFIAAFTIYPVLLVHWVHRKPATGKPPRPPFGRVLLRIGMLVTTRPRTVIAVFAVTAALSAMAATQLQVRNHIFEELRASNPVYRDNQWFEERLGGVLPLELVVSLPVPLQEAGEREAEIFRVLADLEAVLDREPVVGGHVSLQAFREEARLTFGSAGMVVRWPVMRRALERMGSEKELARFLSADGRSLRISARCKALSTDQAREVTDRIAAQGRAVLPQGYGLDLTGRAMTVDAAAGDLVSGLAQSIGSAFVVISITMGLLFGSARAGFLSMIPNVYPLIVAVGAMGLLGITARISTMLIFSIALGMAVDDTIHFLSRYRHERPRALTVAHAVRRGLRGAGAGMVVTSLLLVFGYSVLMFSTFRATMHFALLGSIIVIAALAGDLLLMPALIMVFGWDEERTPPTTSGPPPPPAPR